MTNSNRFKKAHEKAKQIRRFCSDYRTAFRLALIEIYQEEKEIADLALFRLFDVEEKPAKLPVTREEFESDDEFFFCYIGDENGGFLGKESQEFWSNKQ